MPSTYDNPSSDRPLGITILCILGAIGVVVSFFGGLGALGSGGAGILVGAFVLAVAVGQAVVLNGLWRLQHWGYKWALVFYGLSAVVDLVQFNALGLILDLLIIAYLFSVEDHFE
ncbi:hypothetical protein NGM10_16240 (plasmid) [Halorussus salilacus]|uniref:hypothetical protein n=1 Tax=Halorussus salilacus TaxID=2953750 RepID=UPI0020A21612|nr:hypothetical protein [Halorussus salilacus]USZ69952.1 hypothetical protein NGM10_16240 [Halorussus salilacus]